MEALIERIHGGGFWLTRPAIYDESAEYLEKNLGAADWRRHHKFEDAGHWVAAQTLIAETALYAGSPLITYGQVVSATPLRPKPDVQTWRLQLRPVLDDGSLDQAYIVYAEVTVPRRTRFEIGMNLFVRGVALAAGRIPLRSGGNSDGVYLIGSAAAKPAGEAGRGPIPPLPGRARGNRSWVGAPVLPEEERVVNETVRAIQRSNLWSEPPSISQRGVAAFRRRFEELDPRVRHPWEHSGQFVPVQRLVDETPLYEGRVVRVYGRVANTYVIRVAGPSHVVQAVSIDDELGGAERIHCTVHVARRFRFKAGERVMARGVPIASGSFEVSGGGFRVVQYLICAAARRY